MMTLIEHTTWNCTRKKMKNSRDAGLVATIVVLLVMGLEVTVACVFMKTDGR
jgi:hypothetical protein